MSEDQKRAYYYILSQELTYLSENDAYTIALRLPPDIDRYTRWDFEECVQWFQFNKAENSNPAHFIKCLIKNLNRSKNVESVMHKIQAHS